MEALQVLEVFHVLGGVWRTAKFVMQSGPGPE